MYESFLSQKCCADSLLVCPAPVCIRTHKNTHVRTLTNYPVVHVGSSVDYGNRKISSMHFTVRKINVLLYS